MKIKEAAARTGLSEKAIRLYESKHLITPQTYELNGRTFREYTEENVRTLTEIATLRRAFLSVEQIRRILCEPEKASEVIVEYRETLSTDYAAMTPLITRLKEADLSTLHGISSVAELLGAEHDSCIPVPRELRLSPLDETSEEERSAAYRTFLRHQVWRDRRDTVLHVCGRVLRITGISAAVLIGVGVLLFLLGNFRFVKQVEITLDAIEWREGQPDSVIPRTVTLRGEVRDYLFRDDTAELEVSISGYTPLEYLPIRPELRLIRPSFGDKKWRTGHGGLFDSLYTEEEAILLTDW